MEELKELEEIIYQYDNFCCCWIDEADSDKYCEEMDDMRNRALEIIAHLKNKD